MTEKENINDLINRYQQRIVNNDFVKNPYYQSVYAERKEILEKMTELKLLIK